MIDEREKVDNIMEQAAKVFYVVVFEKDEEKKKAVILSFQDQIDTFADKAFDEDVKEELNRIKDNIDWLRGRN